MGIENKIRPQQKLVNMRGIYMIKTPVCQIVGYKNSGKTTFMSKLINYYTLQGMRVGALKHHGHGGEPAYIQETDSGKHWNAGAAISGVQGESTLQLLCHPEEPLNLKEILAMYELSEPDIILVEGYKHASFPKIVLLRDARDEQLLKEVTNTIALGSRDKALLQNRSTYTFPLSETDNNITDIAAYIQKKIVYPVKRNKGGI